MPSITHYYSLMLLSSILICIWSKDYKFYATVRLEYQPVLGFFSEYHFFTGKFQVGMLPLVICISCFCYYFWRLKGRGSNMIGLWLETISELVQSLEKLFFFFLLGIVHAEHMLYHWTTPSASRNIY